MRYDISFDPVRRRWYLDASWKLPPRRVPDLAGLRAGRVLAVDVNAGHLAAMIVDSSGNPVRPPATIPLDLAGLPASARDGRLRRAITELLRLATGNGCAAVVAENLDFLEARAEGKERTGNRPARGRNGRAYRRLVAGIPTARFRDRLVQMAANAGVWVIAVDPAYTTMWGAQHWLGALQQQISDAASGHHAAALVIGRRGLGQRARRRERCAWRRPEDRNQRATNSAERATPATAGLPGQPVREPGTLEAPGRPRQRHKTQTAKRKHPGDQVAQDRSEPPAEPGSTPAQRVGSVLAMGKRDDLEALSSRELHDRAVHRAVRHLDVAFLWELLREIPAAEAAQGHEDIATADVSKLSALVSDALASGEGDVAEALRPLYISYLEKHSES